MNEVWVLLQDNVAMTAFLGVIVAIVFQWFKGIKWFENLAGSDLWKGRVTSLLVSVVATIGALAASGEWAGIWPAIVAGFQTWFISQGAWAGIIKGAKL